MSAQHYTGWPSQPQITAGSTIQGLHAMAVLEYSTYSRPASVHHAI